LTILTRRWEFIACRILRAAAEDYHADVEAQKMSDNFQAKRSDAVEEFVRQEQDENAENGQFDQYDPASTENAAKKKRGPAPAVNLKKSFVKRSGRFVPVTSVQDLKEGEPFFRHRKKSFGVAERYIKYANVKEK
jgi:hypothetical protein